MEQGQTGKPAVSREDILRMLVTVGIERAMQREALKNVTQEMRDVALTAQAMGIPDAQIARASGVSLTSVREWFGKRNNG